MQLIIYAFNVECSSTCALLHPTIHRTELGETSRNGILITAAGLFCRLDLGRVKEREIRDRTSNKQAAHVAVNLCSEMFSKVHELLQTLISN